jgi:hypothetical protein
MMELEAGNPIHPRPTIWICGQEMTMPRYEDITLSNYLGFQKYAEQFTDLVTDLAEIPVGEESTRFRSIYTKMSKVKALAIAEFFGVKTKDILLRGRNSLAVDEAIDLVFDMIIETLSQYSPKIYDEGEPFEFIHHGEKYIVRSVDNERDLTMEELVESLEVERALSIFRTANKPDKSSKPGKPNSQNSGAKAPKKNESSDIFFTEAVSLLAILARKEGEILPDGDSDVEKLLAKRKELFMDVHFAVGVDIVFFFAGITTKLGEQPA